ncbi:GntR family transcriptional regulator [Asanoa sp. NPDC050611]|uniref:GntR family transcriptional regulator n=1 Tax=Asanoa sp. NPDC050611 TaxID=3157098 RepID=UPI0033FE9557
MIVEVDPTGPLPPFEQVRSQIATMIESGVLPPGSQLPTIRQLANDLGLATRTVARAYRELENHGLVNSRVRHGTVVAQPKERLSPSEVQTRLADAARTYLVTARLLGVSKEDALRLASKVDL